MKANKFFWKQTRHTLRSAYSWALWCAMFNTFFLNLYINLFLQKVLFFGSNGCKNSIKTYWRSEEGFCHFRFNLIYIGYKGSNASLSILYSLHCIQLYTLMPCIQSKIIQYILLSPGRMGYIIMLIFFHTENKKCSELCPHELFKWSTCT